MNYNATIQDNGFRRAAITALAIALFALAIIASRKTQSASSVIPMAAWTDSTWTRGW